MEKEIFQQVKNIVKAIDDKLGEDIVVLNLGQVSPICDYFVIATGKSDRQVKAIADEVENQLKETGGLLSHKEGHRLGRWILLDYGDIVVHIFHEEDREFYSIERIWKDALVENIDKFMDNDI
ncbi:iojap-like protein [Alkaliphilus metalliredigens QYMF]|uniref:Ribosomal silencing factor RsfS n=1 Tax=Alkaliphilus metalliredigens (strain QYMF) TaxID=293826 RepID=A6TQK2_ALKMQ|nr:ribosome silencing factor [Alkaliphilus metalliredigens]ABR48470.1 iojap-like protein [Alkaliphilus metalliredigens QYMF]